MDEQFKKNVSLLKSMKLNFENRFYFNNVDITKYNNILNSLGPDYKSFMINPAELKPEVVVTNTVANTRMYSEPRIDKDQFYQKLDAALIYLESQVDNNHVSDTTANAILSNIFNNFPEFYHQLKRRHGNRPTIEITDEYDVQDLLHSIFKLHFENVIKEEPTPTHADRSSRIDFSLPDEKILIEVKHTHKGKGKKIGDEISIDISYYTKYKDYHTLYIFIYDPENFIDNRAGFIKDFEKLDIDGKTIKVFIAT